MTYNNFRNFLRDFYLERKEFGFSFREFSKIAGYSSPVFIKLVIEGKANLSEVGTERIANALGFAGADLKYFRTLVLMNQSSNETKKKELFKALRSIAKANKVKIIDEEQYDYYESWLSPVLREALPQMSETSTSEISKKLVFKKSQSEIKKALQILLNAEFLTKDAKGKFVQTNKKLSTGNLEIPSLAVREMHRQMGKLAVEALDTVPVEDRDISGLTIGIPEEAVSRIKNEIAEFRRKISSIATETPKTSRVYRLNVQLFPLTHKLSKNANFTISNGGEK